jgi:hypothetical protein
METDGQGREENLQSLEKGRQRRPAIGRSKPRDRLTWDISQRQKGKKSLHRQKPWRPLKSTEVSLKL